MKTINDGITPDELLWNIDSYHFIKLLVESVIHSTSTV